MPPLEALTQGGEQAGAVKTIGSESKKLIECIVQAQQVLQGGLKLWTRNLLSQEDAETLRARIDDVADPILVQLEGSSRKALNPKEAYNMVPGRDPENV